MIEETIAAFKEAGLEVGTDQGKTHWTSYPPKPQEQIQVGGTNVQWEPTLTFVGTVIDPLCNSQGAVDHRLAQATKAYGRWRQLLLHPDVPRLRRINLAVRAVFASVLWLSSTWYMTKALSKRVESWGARMVARVAHIRPRSEEPIGEYWRRMHRSGHATV